MLKVSPTLTVPLSEIALSAVRSQGAGGQNVNKVASAIHLRFDVRASSLPDLYKSRLLALADQRITKDGVIVIKAQQHRSQDMNRDEALTRLAELIGSVTVTRRPRRATKPTRGSKERRLESKARLARIKVGRGRVSDD